MIIPATNPLVTSANASPKPNAAQNSSANAEPSAFAKLLQQRQNAAPAPKATAAKPAGETPKPPAHEKSASATTPAHAPASAQKAPSPAGKTAQSQKTQAQDAQGKATTASARPAEGKKAAATDGPQAGQAEELLKAAGLVEDDDRTDAGATLTDGTLTAALPTAQSQAPLPTAPTTLGLPGATTPVPQGTASAAKDDPLKVDTARADVRADARVEAPTASAAERPTTDGLGQMPKAATGKPDDPTAAQAQGDRTFAAHAAMAGMASAGADARGDTLKSLAASMEKSARPVSAVGETTATTALPSALALASPAALPRTQEAQTVQVNTPVQAPEFREALATQVSLLAKDGVQQASLQLNPADMGPISVQIMMDGTQARVDFAVDSATTRQIIEAGLPELAGALRDAGLTLSGGGVSQQNPHAAQQEGRRAGDGGNGTGRGGQKDDQGTIEAAPRRTVSMSTGGLDLYA